MTDGTPGQHMGAGEAQPVYFHLLVHACVSRISQEQCCAAAAEDALCDGGVSVALAAGECERAFVQTEPCRSLASKVMPRAVRLCRDVTLQLTPSPFRGAATAACSA